VYIIVLFCFSNVLNTHAMRKRMTDRGIFSADLQTASSPFQPSLLSMDCIYLGKIACLGWEVVHTRLLS
jgi:hypothetical protein